MTSQPAPPNPLLQAALTLAKRGWLIVPLKSRGKTPLFATGIDHLEAATTDAQQIKAWWLRWPDANVGVVTGAASGLIDVETDPPDGEETWAALQLEHGDCPEPVAVFSTPRGSLHRIYPHPGGARLRCSAGALGPGVDVRGDGGLFVAPPSIHPDGGEYRWVEGAAPNGLDHDPVPAWLLARLTMPERHAGDYSGELPETVGQGQRDTWMTSQAGRLRGGGMVEGEIRQVLALLNARCVPPLDARALDKIARSVCRYPAGQPVPTLPESLTWAPEALERQDTSQAHEDAPGPGREGDEASEQGGEAEGFNRLLWEPMEAWPEATDPLVAEMNKAHWFVMISGKAAVCSKEWDPELRQWDIGLSRPADFVHRYKNRKVEVGSGKAKRTVTAADYWMGHPERREYLGGIKFLPGEPCPRGYYNLFLGLPVQPRKGASERFWAHVLEVIADGREDVYLFIRRWCAQIFQRPWELSRSSVAITGPEGAGKGAFVDRLGDLLGPYYLAVSRIDRVTGKFNSHLANRLLIYANEAVWGGNKAETGSLKSLVTDAWSDLERKGYDVIRSRNLKRLIVNSNEKWLVPQGMGDRRFLTHRCSDRYVGNRDYFRKLFAEAASPAGLSAILYDLLTEDLSDWDSTDIPATEEAGRNKLRSANGVHQWWYQVLRDGCHVARDPVDPADGWVTDPPRASLYEAFCKAAREGGRYAQCSDVVFGQEIRDVVPAVHSRERFVVLSRIGQTEERYKRRCYVIPPLAECRRYFAKKYGLSADVWKNEGDAEEDEDAF